MKCGLSSRLRISNNVRRCYITRSIPICCENIDVEETKVYRLLTNWPGKYRFDINVVMKEISENETMAAEAKLRYIAFLSIVPKMMQKSIMIMKL